MYGHAQCDISGDIIAIDDGVLAANTNTGEWFFCRPDRADEISNKFPFFGTFQVKSQLDFVGLLSALAKKSWFNPDMFFAKLKTLA